LPEAAQALLAMGIKIFQVKGGKFQKETIHAGTIALYTNVA